MQSIDLGYHAADLEVTQPKVDRVLRAPVSLVTTLLTRAIHQGSISQIYRLSRWIAAKENGPLIFESLSSLLLTSALETMQSTLVSGKKEHSTKLSVPGIVCCLLWGCVTMRALPERNETKYHVAKHFWIQFCAKMSSQLDRIQLPPRARLARRDRIVVVRYWNALLDELRRIEHVKEAMYLWAFVWQMSLVLDTLVSKRKSNRFSASISSLMTRDISISLLSCIVTANQPGFCEHMIQHWRPAKQGERETNASERVELGKQASALDAQMVAPLVILLLRQVCFFEKSEFLLDYVEACTRSSTDVVSQDTIVFLMDQLVENLVRLGCVVQAVALVRSIEKATTLWIPGRLKSFVLSGSARAVMQWNTNAAWEAYKNRLECSLLPVSATSLHRPTSWAQSLEKQTQWRASIDMYADPIVWLMFQTRDGFDCNLVPRLFVSIPRWCAVPTVPQAISAEEMSYQLKEAWLGKLKRPLGCKSFFSAWQSAMASSGPDLVFETLLPGWFFIHRPVVNRAWPLVWSALVEELAPEALREGFKMGLHPALLKLTKEYLTSRDDAVERQNVATMMDFVVWSAQTAHVTLVPAWVYLYESVWRQGVPLQKKIFDDFVDAPSSVAEWVSHVSTRQLMGWCLGIRAIETMKLKNNQVPTLVARAVLKELIKRPGVKKHFLESRFQVWSE